MIRRVLRVSRCGRADLPWRSPCLAGLIRSQGPDSRTQSRQRLGGALEELNRIVSEFDAEVRRQNLTRAEGLSRLEHNDDPWPASAARTWARRSSAPSSSTSRIQAMNSAGPLMRLYVVATNFDPEIARSTLDNYEPAEPLSLAALAAGGLAALWGWAATLLIAWPFRRRSRLAPRARHRGRPTRDEPPPIARPSLSRRNHANWIAVGFAAIVAALTPASVRLSPCEDRRSSGRKGRWWRGPARPRAPAPATCRRSGRRTTPPRAGWCPDLRRSRKARGSFRCRSPPLKMNCSLPLVVASMDGVGDS